MIQKKPSNPSENTRNLLFRSLSWVVTVALLVGVVTSVAFGVSAAMAWIAGVLVVVLPDIWLAQQLTSGKHPIPVVLGLSKYVLSGAGFAVLFALRPETPVLWVMLGAVTTIVSIPVAVTVFEKGTTENQG